MDIRTEEFVLLLWEAKEKSQLAKEEVLGEKSAWLFQYGYEKGWLTDFDQLERKSPLLRSSCARIVREFLRGELQEADTTEVEIAKQLKDLYDCRVCAAHVMQTYAKGIIEEAMPGIFDMRGKVSKDEATAIVARVFDPELRVDVKEKAPIWKEEPV